MAEEVFTRKATGVVREASWFQALMSNIAQLQIGLPGFYVFLTAWMFPGWDVPTVFLLSLIPVTTHAILLSIMTSQFPRSGGDYVWASRILPPYIVISTIFALQVIGALVTPGFIDWGIYGGLGTVFTCLGISLNNPAISSISTTLQDPNVRFLIVSILIWVFAIVNIKSLKLSLKWISVMAILGTIAGLVSGFTLLFSSNQYFITQWNNLFGSYLTYDQVINTAISNGYEYIPIGLGTFGTLFGLIACTYEMNIGYAASISFAGEIKSARRSIPIATLACVALGAVVLFIMCWAQQNVVGQKFIYSSMYLFYSKPELWTVPAPADPFLYAVIATGLNPILAVIIPLGLLSGCLGLVAVSYIVSSRYWLAFSFDRFLPTFFSKVDKKHHTPWVSILFFGIIYEIGLAFSCYYAAGVVYIGLPYRSISLLNNALIAAAVLLFPVIAKSLYEHADVVKRHKVLTLLSAVITFAFFAFAAINVVIHPEYGGPPNIGVWIFMIILLLLGPIIWLLSKIYWSRRGLDTSLVYKEVPPE